MVCVREAHDIVFAQVRARLHLDDLERDRPGVFQSVLDAEGDIRRLILRQ